MRAAASRSKGGRQGFTTGACAAAAAKAALSCLRGAEDIGSVEIPFPDGIRRVLPIERVWTEAGDAACACVIKDAGDDPDVTNGAEIIAKVAVGRTAGSSPPGVVIRGGQGVGVVTRPGLCLAVGEPAINPVPRRMVTEAVIEAMGGADAAGVEVTISVPEGERLAKKTLNGRLGITGGISILGTTGIVKPLSAEAWTATITACLDVGAAMGRREIVLSTGRSSERAHEAAYGFPEECYVMMGDYVEYALSEARRHRFERVHLCGQWAKMLKIAMATGQTHVANGVIDPQRAAAFLAALGAPVAGGPFNTAREIYEVASAHEGCQAVFSLLCAAARRFAEKLTGGLPVRTHLVSYSGEVIAADG